MSIGCLIASGKRDYTVTVLPATIITVALAFLLLFLYQHNNITIDVGNQLSDQAQWVYFGTEYRARDISSFFIPLWMIAGIFFFLISLMFIGLGQIMGRAFSEIPDRIATYTVNITGNLAGIAVFFIVSIFQLPPYIWFAICIIIFLYFIRGYFPLQIIEAIIILCIVSASGFYSSHLNIKEQWSPYYKINYIPDTGYIETNNMPHQGMISLPKRGSAYVLPHLLKRDAGKKPFKNILIIGAGSGNDLSAALSFANNDTLIDAVEIDPVILNIGKSDHPNKPYLDPRVTSHLDDGRNFLKKNIDKKYDLIVYALVDSLVLHSGYSSLRLESFLFTQEAFRDIKNRLKPDGIFIMYNQYRQGWIIGRLVKMSEEIFKSEPIVISLPYKEEIDMGSSPDAFTIILSGNGENENIQAIKNKFKENKSFWISEPWLNYPINGFSKKPPDKSKGQWWAMVAPSRINTETISILPGDNWPFLYLRNREIPMKPTGEGILVIGVISLIILFSFLPGGIRRINWQMFFLGAGFMLLETRGVVHMALLFGSTWIVNLIVFAAILIMVLLGNLFVRLIKPKKLYPYYGLLIIALLINMFVPITYFLSLSSIIRPFVSCAVIFIPIFFANIIFSTVFRDSREANIDIGSNIAGVVLGGLCENLSLIIGFNYLLIIAILFYILSSLRLITLPVRN